MAHVWEFLFVTAINYSQFLIFRHRSLSYQILIKEALFIVKDMLAGGEVYFCLFLFCQMMSNDWHNSKWMKLCKYQNDIKVMTLK